MPNKILFRIQPALPGPSTAQPPSQAPPAPATTQQGRHQLHQQQHSSARRDRHQQQHSPARQTPPAPTTALPATRTGPPRHSLPAPPTTTRTTTGPPTHSFPAPNNTAPPQQPNRQASQAIIPNEKVLVFGLYCVYIILGFRFDRSIVFSKMFLTEE